MARTRSGRNTAGRGRRPAGRGGRTGRGSAARGGRGGRGGQANAPQRNPLPAVNQDVNMNDPLRAWHRVMACRTLIMRCGSGWVLILTAFDASGIRTLVGSLVLVFLLTSPTTAWTMCSRTSSGGGGDLPGGQNLNRGMRLPPPVKSNIQNLAFYCHYTKRAMRPLVPWEITPHFLRHFHTIKRNLTTRDVPPAPVINDRDWPKTFDSLEEYLNGCKGSDIATLGYDTRPTEAPVDYPGEISELNYHGGFSPGVEELINRCPIVDERGRRLAQFNMDNRRVWEKLVGICHDHPCFTYAKVGQMLLISSRMETKRYHQDI